MGRLELKKLNGVVHIEDSTGKVHAVESKDVDPKTYGKLKKYGEELQSGDLKFIKIGGVDWIVHRKGRN